MGITLFECHRSDIKFSKHLTKSSAIRNTSTFHCFHFQSNLGICVKKLPEGIYDTVVLLLRKVKTGIN